MEVGSTLFCTISHENEPTLTPNSNADDCTDTNLSKKEGKTKPKLVSDADQKEKLSLDW